MSTPGLAASPLLIISNLCVMPDSWPRCRAVLLSLLNHCARTTPPTTFVHLGNFFGEQPLRNARTAAMTDEVQQFLVQHLPTAVRVILVAGEADQVSDAKSDDEGSVLFLLANCRPRQIQVVDRQTSELPPALLIPFWRTRSSRTAPLAFMDHVRERCAVSAARYVCINNGVELAPGSMPSYHATLRLHEAALRNNIGDIVHVIGGFERTAYTVVRNDACGDCIIVGSPFQLNMEEQPPERRVLVLLPFGECKAFAVRFSDCPRFFDFPSLSSMLCCSLTHFQAGDTIRARATADAQASARCKQRAEELEKLRCNLQFKDARKRTRGRSRIEKPTAAADEANEDLGSAEVDEDDVGTGSSIASALNEANDDLDQLMTPKATEHALLNYIQRTRFKIDERVRKDPAQLEQHDNQCNDAAAKVTEYFSPANVKSPSTANGDGAPDGADPPFVHLSRVRLKQFMNVTDSEAVLSQFESTGSGRGVLPHLVHLDGENGSGKSTVLNATHWALLRHELTASLVEESEEEQLINHAARIADKKAVATVSLEYELRRQTGAQTVLQCVRTAANFQQRTAVVQPLATTILASVIPIRPASWDPSKLKQRLDALLSASTFLGDAGIEAWLCEKSSLDAFAQKGLVLLQEFEDSIQLQEKTLSTRFNELTQQDRILTTSISKVDLADAKSQLKVYQKQEQEAKIAALTFDKDVSQNTARVRAGELDLEIKVVVQQQTQLEQKHAQLRDTHDQAIELISALDTLDGLLQPTSPSPSGASNCTCPSCQHFAHKVYNLAAKHEQLLRLASATLSEPAQCPVALGKMRQYGADVYHQLSTVSEEIKNLIREHGKLSDKKQHLDKYVKACESFKVQEALVAEREVRVSNLCKKQADVRTQRDVVSAEKTALGHVLAAIESQREALRDKARAGVAGIATAILHQYMSGLDCKVRLTSHLGAQAALYGGTWQRKWSKGETQLILMSLAFALRRLVLGRFRLGLNLLCLDEAFSNVDLNKVPACLSWIWRESQWYAKRCSQPLTVYIVAHVELERMFRTVEVTRHANFHVLPLNRLLQPIVPAPVQSSEKSLDE